MPGSISGVQFCHVAGPTRDLRRKNICLSTFMATCSNGAVLQSKLQNGTLISFCGLPFDERQTCGFLQREESIGVQLCCALTEAIGSSEAICQYTIGERIGQLIEILASL